MRTIRPRPLTSMALVLAVSLLDACESSPVDTGDAGRTLLVDDTGLAKGSTPTGVSYLVSAIPHGGPFQDPTWTSTRDGTTSETTLFTTWTGDALVITPTGSAYTLGDDAHMTVNQRSGTILGVTLYIQDVTGPAGVQHETNRVMLSTPVAPSASGFVLHVHRDGVPVYRLKGHTGGPRVGMIGLISVGDVVFTPR